MLERWSSEYLDTRPFRKRPQAVSLYCFYRQQIDRLAMLRDLPEPSDKEQELIGVLDELLDEDYPVETVLARMDGRRKRLRTGDKRYDGWIEDLDRGVVPPEFWGPDGPPAGYVPGA